MASASGWRLWASSFRVLNRRAAARAMRPSGTARRMSRGTSEDLLADCITHRPPQQLLPTGLRCLPAKGRWILAHALGTAERSVQQIGDQVIGIVGELAVIDGLAFLEDQEAGEGGDGVLLREDTVAVEEDRGSQRPAGKEGLDGGALLLEVDGHHPGAWTPAAGERLDALDDVVRARRPGAPDDHDHGS